MIAMHSQDRNEIAAALAKAQGAMAPAVFNKVNFFKSKYADLASIMEAAREPLAANGLAVTQALHVPEEGGLCLVTTLLHTSGQWIASRHPLPTVARPHELGSALTYARRYSYAALVGIVAEEDDDAEAAQQAGQKQGQAPRPAPPKPAARIAKPAPPSKPLLPEHDPLTGETGPRSLLEEGRPNWIAFGQRLIAAVDTAQTFEQYGEWMDANQDHLDRMREEAPKVYGRLTAATDKLRNKLMSADADRIVDADDIGHPEKILGRG
jgi:ERF superfamily